MNLTPRELDKLLIAMAAMVARRRLERGVKLNHPEAVALISDSVVEGARDLVDAADAALGDPQVALELPQQVECPVDVSRRRVCGMTKHRDPNLGQIALFDKALHQVGWGNLPCD